MSNIRALLLTGLFIATPTFNYCASDEDTISYRLPENSTTISQEFLCKITNDMKKHNVLETQIAISMTYTCKKDDEKCRIQLLRIQELVLALASAKEQLATTEAEVRTRISFR